MSDQMVEVGGMDPYAVLGLRAGAPRELVEEAYWLLVGRHSSRDGTPEIERRRILRELNAAYEKIAREPGRAVARTPMAAPGRTWWRRQSVPQAWTHGPHQTLHLSNEADGEIATLARRVLTERAPAWMSRAAWEHVLSSAVARLLSNGAANGKREETVRSDVHEAAATAAASETATATNGASATATTPNGAMATAVRPQAPAPIAESVVAKAGEHAAEVTPATAVVVAYTGAVTPSLDDGEASSLVMTPAAEPAELPAVAMPAVEAEAAADVPAPTRSPRREAAEEGHHAPLLDRVLHRKARQDDLDEHLQSRLLQLREHVGNGAAAPAAAAVEPSAAPQERRRELSAADITESGIDVTLGDGSQAASVRIWRRGGTCLMQLAEGGPVLVNDEPLHAPVIVLEGGDRISFEGHEVLLRD